MLSPLILGCAAWGFLTTLSSQPSHKPYSLLWGHPMICSACLQGARFVCSVFSLAGRAVPTSWVRSGPAACCGTCFPLAWPQWSSFADFSKQGKWQVPRPSACSPQTSCHRSFYNHLLFPFHDDRCACCHCVVCVCVCVCMCVNSWTQRVRAELKTGVMSSVHRKNNSYKNKSRSKFPLHFPSLSLALCQLRLKSKTHLKISCYPLSLYSK